MKNLNFEAVFTPYLNENETLLWTARPGSGFKFRAIDFFVIPFSIVYCMGGLFALRNILPSDAPILVKLFVFLIATLGIYLLVNRFFLDAFLRTRTVYGLTNQRIIIWKSLFRPGITSIDLRTMPHMTLEEKADSSGVITIWTHAKLPTRVEYIQDVRVVYDKILALQTQTGRF